MGSILSTVTQATKKYVEQQAILQKMFALTPTFYQPLQRRKFFEEIDMVDSLMDNFFTPKMRMPFCPEMICQTSNERSLRLPMDIPRENIKTTINKKTGVLTVEASNENEKDVSRYGWTGTQNSFSSFKKSIKLPEYVLTDDDLLAKISADLG